MVDIANLAAGSFGATAAQNRSQAATTILKQNLDSQKAVLKLLEPSPELRQANLPPGVGGKVDKSA